MIESGLYNYWRKLTLMKSFNKRKLDCNSQNDNLKALDIKLILIAFTLSSFFIIGSIIILISEVIISFIMH